MNENLREPHFENPSAKPQIVLIVSGDFELSLINFCGSVDCSSRVTDCPKVSSIATTGMY